MFDATTESLKQFDELVNKILAKETGFLLCAITDKDIGDNKVEMDYKILSAGLNTEEVAEFVIVILKNKEVRKSVLLSLTKEMINDQLN